MTKDMTTRSPMKLVLSFAIPLMFGNLFQGQMLFFPMLP